MWFLGDLFLASTHDAYKEAKTAAEHDKDVVPYFMEEFFNVEFFYRNSCSNKLAGACIINALTDAVNTKNTCLPKYLVVVIDKDLIGDIDEEDREDAERIIPILTNWLVRQVYMTLRRKRVDLFDKKPGAVAGCHTRIIFVHMLCRVGSFSEHSKIRSTYSLRA